MKGIVGGSAGFCKLTPKEKADAKFRKEHEKKKRVAWMKKHEKNKLKTSGKG